MNRLYVFLIQNDVWIYILCGLGIFWYLNELFRARRLLQRAVFGLEKETGGRMQSTALTFLSVMTLIVVGVVYVNVSIRPTLPAELLVPPTPTPNIFRTPLSSPTPLDNFLLQPDETPTPPIVATVTLPGDGVELSGGGEAGNNNTVDETDVEATVPSDFTPEAAATFGCTSEINISSPSNGAALFGAVAFLGTANVDQFAFYKLEVRGPETNGQWASVLGQVITQPIVNGLLGSGSFNGWQSGRYDVRLTVVDTTSNEAGSCTIQVDVNR